MLGSRQLVIRASLFCLAADAVPLDAVPLDAEEVKRLKDILAEFDRTTGGSTIGPPSQEIFPGSTAGY